MAMDCSRLWYKISIYEFLEQLDKRDLELVVQFMKDDLNITIANNVNNHVTAHKDIIKQFLFNDNNQMADENIDLLIDLWQYVKPLKPTKKRSKSKTNIKKCHIVQLPVDLITHTALFLDEIDVLQFERCCRLLYRCINTLSFISKSNNFKQLYLTREKIIDYISQHPFDFFKFNKLSSLRISHISAKDDVQLFRNQFNKIFKQDWFRECLKSIRKLELFHGGSYLLDLFPICDLQQLDFFEVCNCFHQVIAEKNEQMNEKMKQLSINRAVIRCGCANCVECYSNCGTKSCISKYDDSKLFDRFMKSFDIKHLELSLLVLDMSFFENISKYHPNLTTFTLGEGASIIGSKTYNYLKTDRLPLNINTLICKSVDVCDIDRHPIVCNESTIEFLNLDKSLKNLTVIFDVDTVQWNDLIDSSRQKCNTLIRNILKKYYFCNLENLNLLVLEWCNEDSLGCDILFCHELFDTLLKLKQLLKHQFKQLNVGYEYKDCENDMDAKTIDKYEFRWCDEMTDDDVQTYRRRWDQVVNYFVSGERKRESDSSNSNSGNDGESENGNENENASEKEVHTQGQRDTESDST